MNISVIGSGNMGGALVRGWYKTGKLNLTATAHTQATLDRLQQACPNIRTTTINAQAIAGADVVVLAVKPWLVDDVIAEISNELKPEQLLVSVAANAKHDRIDVYAMPNLAAECHQSMTFVSDERVKDLFDLVGKTMVVNEKQMQAGMKVGGCGIAYVMRFLRAMQQGGVEMGLYPAQAQEIAMQTLEGAIAFLHETGLHPEAAIDRVTTPGGITIRGLNELDHSGFTSAVIRCLKA